MLYLSEHERHRPRTPRQRSMRAGLSLIEVLVVISIISILMSFVVAAVMSARESARRMQCASHLKQIGIAIQNYESLHGYLPCSGLLGLRYLSTFVEGRPGNWNVYGDPDPCMYGPCHEVGDWSRPKVYLCPSDELVMRTKRSASYVFSSGTSVIANGTAGISDGYGAADEVVGKQLAMRDISDGASQTACCSEQLIAPIRVAATPEEFSSYLISSSVPSDALRHTWTYTGTYSLPQQLEALFRECDGSTLASIHSAGYSYNNRVTSYSHVRTPNSRSCDGATPNVALSGPINPATSRHRGGVNVLMCDGAVRFASNSIDLATWQAIGTRNSSDRIGDW